MTQSPSGWGAAGLSVVALAAGLGRRYGGFKQRDPLGPGGTTLLDFSLYDAQRAGFRRAVFVVHPEMLPTWGPELRQRYGRHFEVVIVAQQLEDVPIPVAALRQHPWGTTQALLAAREAVPGSFAVINADDCYGLAALRTAATFLADPGPSPVRAGVVAFRLDRTLSPSSGVNRAVLEADPGGRLRGAVEVRDLHRLPDGGIAGRLGDQQVRYADPTLVSMNLWAFAPAILPLLAVEFRRFLEARPGPESECDLPTAVAALIAREALVVQVLPTSSQWCGVTAPGDRARVSGLLADRVRAGEYPERPWP